MNSGLQQSARTFHLGERTLTTTSLRFVLAGVGHTTHTIMKSTLGTFSILVTIGCVSVHLDLRHSKFDIGGLPTVRHSFKAEPNLEVVPEDGGVEPTDTVSALFSADLDRSIRFALVDRRVPPNFLRYVALCTQEGGTSVTPMNANYWRISARTATSVMGRTGAVINQVGESDLVLEPHVSEEVLQQFTSYEEQRGESFRQSSKPKLSRANANISNVLSERKRLSHRQFPVL